MARPGLTGHRKFRRLARALGSALIARGALELLWESCYESGEEYVGTSDDIENLVGWAGVRGVLTRALVDAGAPEGHGFIEPVLPGDAHGQPGLLDAADAGERYRVHDLWHHAPDYVTKRRKRELERRQKFAPDVVGQTAPNGGHLPPSSDWQIGDARPPSPSPAPAPSPAPLKSALSPAATPEQVVELWNAIVTSPIPKCQKLTSDRRARISARLRSYPRLETWRQVITFVNGEPWCRAIGTGEHPNWTATIEWLTKSDGNVQRQLEKATTAQPQDKRRAAKPDADVSDTWRAVVARTKGQVSDEDFVRHVTPLKPGWDSGTTFTLYAPSSAFRDAIPPDVEAALAGAVLAALPGRTLQFMWGKAS